MTLTTTSDLKEQNKQLKQEIKKLKEQLNNARNSHWHKISEEGIPKYVGTYLVASRAGNTEKVEMCMRSGGKIDWLVKPHILVDAWMEYPTYYNKPHRLTSSSPNSNDIKFNKNNVVISDIYLIKNT